MSSPSAAFRFGAEVYTWFMNENGLANANRLDHMIQIVARAGFRGIEPMHFWMGDLADPARLAAALNGHAVELAGISLVLDWNHEGETDQERKEADATIQLLTHFPAAALGLVQMPTSRAELTERRKRLVRHVNSVARRAAERGITCSFHPNSPDSSIARTREDYEVLLDGLDRSAVGWTPDVGHIINGGMDPLSVMKEYAALINHVHYKDWNGKPEFCLMGEGKVDFVGITRWLRDRGYGGWIICEDEGAEAVDDPDGVTLRDGEWIQNKLLPQL